MPPQTSPNLIALRNHRVDLDKRTVQLGDEKHSLPPLQARILRVLVETAPGFVSREDLLARAWEVNSLSEQAVNSAISKLRAAFQDTSNAPWLIQTERNRGYRLLVEPQAVEQAPEQTAGHRFLRDYWPVVLVGAVALGLLAWFVTRSPSMEDWLSNPPENWDVEYTEPQR